MDGGGKNTYKWRNQIQKRRRKKGEKDVERDKGKGREDQCKTHIVLYRVKKNTQHNGQLQRTAVFTPAFLRESALNFHLCFISFQGAGFIGKRENYSAE